jgi:hypothetical protein
MNNEVGNIFLTGLSCITAIIATMFIELSPLWEAFIQLAPWASFSMLYLINFDKANNTLKRIWSFLIGFVKGK